MTEDKSFRLSSFPTGSCHCCTYVTIATPIKRSTRTLSQARTVSGLLGNVQEYEAMESFGFYVFSVVDIVALEGQKLASYWSTRAEASRENDLLLI